MNKTFFLSLCLISSLMASGQTVGIGTLLPDSSAVLEVAHNSKGLLIPRMSSADLTAIPEPAKGLLVYDTTSNMLMVNMGTATNPSWQSIASKSNWNLTGNHGTIPGSHFIGTTDYKPLCFRVHNKLAGKIDNDSIRQNTSFGFLSSATQTSYYNTVFGYKSLFKNTTGNSNISIGNQSLFSNTTGNSNQAIGAFALYSNLTGSQNTGTGYVSLYHNTIGSYNTAYGGWTLYDNVSGSRNIAVGFEALGSNLTGSNNTAIGHESMSFNGSGENNTATGYFALRACTTGHQNAAFGDQALALNYTGTGNTALGSHALFASEAAYNTAVGYNAGRYHFLGWNNTFIGAECNATGSGIFNSVALGNATIVTASNQVRIGNSSTTSIGGYANWSNFSDGRFKTNIKEDVKGLEFIMKLRPVTYHLNAEAINAFLHPLLHTPDTATQRAIYDKQRAVQSGFIAQEVEQAALAVDYDFSGVDKPKNEHDLYALRYAEFVVPLVKAMQELVEVVEAQKQEITSMKRDLQALRGKR